MKNNQKIALLLISTVMITAILTGCSDSKKNNNNNSSKSKNDKNISDETLKDMEDSFSNEESDKDGSKTKTADYIQEALDCAKLLGTNMFVDNDNNLFYGGGNFDVNYPLYAYSYGNKDLKGIYDTGYDVFAVTDSGELYNGSTLVTDEFQIKDVILVNHNGTFFITEDGKVLRYKKNGELDLPKPVYSVEELDGCESTITVGIEEKYSLVVFDESGNLYGEGSGSDKLYQKKNSVLFGKCNVEGWENLVLIDGFWDEKNDIACVAGIASDGKVYASGDYADEILSWGELKYISINSYLTVGVKKDGTLAFAGEYADKLKEYDFENVKAAKIERSTLIAVNDEGYYWCDFNIEDDGNVSTKFEFFNDNILKSESYENVNVGYGIIDNSGNIYSGYDDDGYIKSDSDFQEKSIKNADSAKFIYNKLLCDVNRDISWGTNRSGRTYESCAVKDMKFYVTDIDNDGISELILRDDNLPHSNGYMALVVDYNSYPRSVLTDDYITGYYKDTGVVVTDRTNKGYTQRRYWKKEEGYMNPVCYSYTDMNSEDITTKYYVYREFASEIGVEVPDGTGSDDGIEITESQFGQLEQKYFSTNFESISEEDFVENTASNRLEYLLK